MSLYNQIYALYIVLSCANFMDQIETLALRDKNIKDITSLGFPAIYHGTGRIRIPSAGILEPFEVWYAGKYNRSRIDYYNGTVQTYQRADIGKYGTLFEVFPKYDYRHDNHYRGCWKKKGNKKKRIEPQGILPKKVYWPFTMDTSKYKYKGKAKMNGKICNKWVAKINAYNRTDTYTFYATDEDAPKPVTLDMQGYDVLLVSYYDHYIVDYGKFEEWKYNESVFDTPKVAKRDKWCQTVPKRAGEAGYRSLNPMGDFMDEDNNYNHFESKFQKYKEEFNKEYTAEEEYRKRMHIARHNMRYIHSMNRRQLGFNLNVNHFADMSEHEYGSHRGLSFDTLEEIEEFEKHIPVLSLDNNEQFIYHAPIEEKREHSIRHYEMAYPPESSGFSSKDEGSGSGSNNEDLQDIDSSNTYPGENSGLIQEENGSGTAEFVNDSQIDGKEIIWHDSRTNKLRSLATNTDRSSGHYSGDSLSWSDENSGSFQVETSSGTSNFLNDKLDDYKEREVYNSDGNIPSRFMADSAKNEDSRPGSDENSGLLRVKQGFGPTKSLNDLLEKEGQVDDSDRYVQDNFIADTGENKDSSLNSNENLVLLRVDQGSGPTKSLNDRPEVEKEGEVDSSDRYVQDNFMADTIEHEDTIPTSDDNVGLSPDGNRSGETKFRSGQLAAENEKEVHNSEETTPNDFDTDPKENSKDEPAESGSGLPNSINHQLTNNKERKPEISGLNQYDRTSLISDQAAKKSNLNSRTTYLDTSRNVNESSSNGEIPLTLVSNAHVDRGSINRDGQSSRLFTKSISGKNVYVDINNNYSKAMLEIPSKNDMSNRDAIECNTNANNAKDKKNYVKSEWKPIGREKSENKTTNKDINEDNAKASMDILNAECTGNNCNLILNSTEDVSNTTYIAEERDRTFETVEIKPSSKSNDSIPRQRNHISNSTNLDFDDIWSSQLGKSAKPFFMYGVDEIEGDSSQPVIRTYENDFYFKDDSRFPKEFRHWGEKRHKKKRKKYHQKRKLKPSKKKPPDDIPESLDWRDYGAVSPIQSQGICGSCWSFSTAAAVESANFLKTGKLRKLSEQHLIDCTWYVPHSKDGNHACMGGWTWKSFAYIKQFGIATEDSYGKYVGMESSCKTKNITSGATIDSFMKVKANDAKALKKAIAVYGPATASINTETKTLKFYSSGIYNDKECTGNTDHSVLIVGYGEANGKLFWIVRNSWGTAWGERGYIKIENGKCGLLKKPWVIINRHRKTLPWTKKNQSG